MELGKGQLQGILKESVPSREQVWKALEGWSQCLFFFSGPLHPLRQVQCLAAHRPSVFILPCCIWLEQFPAVSHGWGLPNLLLRTPITCTVCFTHQFILFLKQVSYKDLKVVGLLTVNIYVRSLLGSGCLLFGGFRDSS